MKQYLFFLIILLFSFNYSFAQKNDSLHAKRVFISTYIYKDGLKLTNSKVTILYKNSEQSQIKYKWSNILKPIGPVVIIGGIGLAAIALKGVNATAIIDGQTIDYKIRSLPKLLMGLGLVVGGLSMIESSNELAQHSVDIYNSMSKTTKKVGYVDKIKFGITQSNAIGFSVSLK
ncbi:hypothetical protein [Emticicia sp. SJ17W-69]|uniref:hypothetical protein n=1 Tax=Emticicia sp. SJ17W-69 TaxID=3421657 RepID=UPI003EBA4198